MFIFSKIRIPALVNHLAIAQLRGIKLTQYDI